MLLLTVLWQLCLPALGHAQTQDLIGRPVREIKVEGLKEVSEQEVLNHIRVQPGDPYDPAMVDQDVVRITHLNRFLPVIPNVEAHDDGSLTLTYVVTELPIIADVQVVGNKRFTDQELLELVAIRSGDPADPALINEAIARIKQHYVEKGFPDMQVIYDASLLGKARILLLQIAEGQKFRIRGLTFEGNTVFSDKQLRSRIRSNQYFPVLKKGLLSREVIATDTALLRKFYRDRGYLEAEVRHNIDISPNYRDAVVVFEIVEGPLYTVAAIEIKGNEVFTANQIKRIMNLNVGDVYSEDTLIHSQHAIYKMYGKLGYIETRLVRTDGQVGRHRDIGMDRIFHETDPLVDVIVNIFEGNRHIVGDVRIRGNQVTQEKVIQRQLRGVDPGRYFDGDGLERTRRRLGQNPLFREAQVTVLGEVEQEERDVLVEVVEADTGQLSFGAAVNSDAGVVGAIDLVQRNFDVADLPESSGEFFRGKAFRGAGQYFSLSLQPGNRISRYSATLREPYFLETPYFVEGSGFYFQREREDWDEQRIGGRSRVGQRFGDVWSAFITPRAEQININDIERTAPIDVFEVEGNNFLTVLEFAVTRDTTEPAVLPGSGSRTTVILGQAGTLGGDFDFPRLEARWRKFWTVDEDFFGRKTVFSLSMRTGYIFEDAPLFERFYAGGARSFRGYKFRGVGPRGMVRRADGTTFPSDDPVGGNFMFLLGAEYNFPILEEFVRGVLFTDTGTVDTDIDFGVYRVSIGAGVRLLVPILGQVPIGLDFAVPVVKEDFDKERLFSFDVALPLR